MNKILSLIKLLINFILICAVILIKYYEYTNLVITILLIIIIIFDTITTLINIIKKKTICKDKKYILMTIFLILISSLIFIRSYKFNKNYIHIASAIVYEEEEEIESHIFNDGFSALYMKQNYIFYIFIYVGLISYSIVYNKKLC